MIGLFISCNNLKTKIDQNEIKNIFWYRVLIEYDSIHSECIICVDDIKYIVHKYEHIICYRCLNKLKMRSERF